PSASAIDAIATSHPFSAHGRPLLASRTTALIGRPAASRVRATTPPTLPVIPVTAYMICLLPLDYQMVQARRAIRKAAEHAKEEARAGRMVGAQIDAPDGAYGRRFSSRRTAQISSCQLSV